MFKRISTVAVGSAAAFALLAGPALAAVTFDPSTGTGFVGKGDVQVPFGWSNAQLQANASGVDFIYTDRTSYDVTCEQITTETFETGPVNKRKTHTRTITVESVFDERTAVAYDSTTATRKNRTRRATSTGST